MTSREDEALIKQTFLILNMQIIYYFYTNTTFLIPSWIITSPTHSIEMATEIPILIYINQGQHNKGYKSFNLVANSTAFFYLCSSTDSFYNLYLIWFSLHQLESISSSSPLPSVSNESF